jgi:monoamine oxidase
MDAKLDCIVIGAGFSGLAAGRILHEEQKSFLILEARDRVGGRTHTRHFDNGKYVDIGGQWIGPTQDRMYDLAREHGIEWYETYNEGKNILDLNLVIKTYTGLIPKMDIPSLINIDFVLKKLERLAKKIELSNPWSHPSASTWDSMSLEAFVKKHCYTKNCYKVVRAGLETVYACELNEVSLLHALFYIRSGTNLNVLLSIKDGAQQHRIKGGMQSFAEKLAEKFQYSVRLNSSVKQIDQSNDVVSVSGDGFVYQAKYVIVAVPPVLIQEIEFSPSLPFKKQQLLQKLSMGIVGKVFGVYKKPFWRNHGFSGQVVADENAPFQTLFDSSPADSSYGVLLAFCIANRARKFFSQDEQTRKKIALEYFERYFGKEATHPLYYTDHCWADEAWSKGCYAGIYPTGAWTNFQNELARPTVSIFWAGTETSEVWYGYIEGAVRAGERAAHEVLNSLKP